ncbi:MAG: paraquat-inducible protein A [Candidatus Kentron sp. G]|nr:MAG: paraquat-inducible protein A [Candidatus Kentron sp. G]VFM96800.1 MAG: paraquat-inducible protein A [Candidatus Kentron sp. G]VFM98862.1 MAG: paraquat-inducible protein A [Candidatus Kentron sp. G]
MNDPMGISARDAGFVACTTCGKLHRNRFALTARRCVRCASRLHSRKPRSVQRAWALLSTGILLYIPANVYPIMFTWNLGRLQENTIISGILSLWNACSYLVATVIFVASMVIPVMKFVVIAYLLRGVRRKSRLTAGQKARLYRITELIGPWSMVDIFVVALLVALVKMGAIAFVKPGVAAIAFAAMVVATMLAAVAFDPRLLWDNERDEQ